MKQTIGVEVYQNVALAIAVIAVVGGLCAFFVPPGLLEKIFLLFSSDGNIQHKTLVWGKGLLVKGTPFLFVVGVMAAAYAALGRWLDRSACSSRVGDFPAPVPSRKELVYFGCILVVAVMIRWPFMGRSLCFDELFTLTADIASPDRLALFHLGEVQNHIGCSLLAWVSVWFLGVSEWSLRLPSFVLGVFSVGLVWIFVRKILGRRMGLIAALLFAASPVGAIFSASVRGYAGVIFFSVLSAMFYVECLRSPTRRGLLWYCAANVGGLLFHPFFIFVILAETAALATFALVSNKKKLAPAGGIKLWKYQGLLILGAAALYWPRAISLVTEFMAGPSYHVARSLSLEVFKDILGFSPSMLAWAGLFLFCGLSHLRQTRMKEIAGVTVALSVAALFLSWLVPPAHMVTRFWIVLLPFLLIVLAVGIFAVFDQIRQKSFVAALLIAGIFWGFVLNEWIFTESKIVWDSKVPFRELGALARERAGVDTAFFAIGHGDTLFGHYYPDRPIQSVRSVGEYGDFLVRHPQAACFVIPDMEQAPEIAEILRDVKARAREYRLRDVAVYFF